MKEWIKTVLKFLNLYHPLQSSYRSAISFFTNVFYKATYSKYRGSGFACNFCGATYSRFVPDYPSPEIKRALVDNEVIAGTGENVYCPSCMSRNRERLVKIVLQEFVDIRNKKILHFSPEKNLYHHIKPMASVTTVDISPGFYKNIDRFITHADATDLQFPDKTFDILIANHILEHIPEDLKAMKELYRVLKDGGVAVLQVPYSESLPNTIEEPFINDQARQAALFGQRDHVRIYALNDYIRRLQNAGFIVKLIGHESLRPFRIHAIQEKESVILGYKRG
jgi:SAM-dependent methyltransferase